MNRVLIVDDIAAGREIVSKELSHSGFLVDLAASADEALTILGTEQFDLVVADHRKPGIDAIDLIRCVRRTSDVAMIVLAASPSIQDCEQAMRAGADRFLRIHGDVERLGDVAHELLTDTSVRRRVGGRLTREQARALGQRELHTVLQRLVIECRGNIAEIARRMNRDRSTIRYHLRRLDLLE